MTIRPTPSLQAYAPAALAATRVGTWEYDLAADRLRCDALAAGLFGLSPEEGEAGVPVAEVRSGYHPEDGPRVAAEFERACRHGGLIVFEFRMRSHHHGMRWLLSRGFYEADARGRVAVGRGIVIDMTESKDDGYAGGRARFLSSDPPAAPADGPLDAAADAALAARAAIDRVGGRAGRRLRPLADALLMGIGRQLAARLGHPD